MRTLALGHSGELGESLLAGVRDLLALRQVFAREEASRGARAAGAARYRASVLRASMPQLSDDLRARRGAAAARRLSALSGLMLPV